MSRSCGNGLVNESRVILNILLVFIIDVISVTGDNSTNFVLMKRCDGCVLSVTLITWYA